MEVSTQRASFLLRSPRLPYYVWAASALQVNAQTCHPRHVSASDALVADSLTLGPAFGPARPRPRSACVLPYGNVPRRSERRVAAVC